MQTAVQAASSALLSKPNKPSPIAGATVTPLPVKPSQSTLDGFWIRMCSMFGHSWASQYGAKPDGVAAETWATALAGVSNAQIAQGLRETVALGSEFPPSAPRFRALCMGIPSFAHVRRSITTKERTPFMTLVWRNLDNYRFAISDQRAADQMLRDAYEIARDHVMRGGELPEPPIAEIEHKEPERGNPVSAEAVAAFAAKLGVA